jgi:hypothetical protein
LLTRVTFRATTVRKRLRQTFFQHPGTSTLERPEPGVGAMAVFRPALPA